MKVIGVREAKAHLSEVIHHARTGPVLITSHGKPAVMVTSVEGEEMSDLVMENDPKFLAFLQERSEQAARGRRYSLAEIEAKVREREKREAQQPRRRRRA